MSRTEAGLIKRIQVAATRAGARLFRNQVGTYRLRDGRVLSSGLCTGSSDLVGWVPVEVTPDMVGQRVAVFVAVEAKADQTRTTQQQRAFIDKVRSDGGRAGVAHTPSEAEAIMRGES